MAEGPSHPGFIFSVTFQPMPIAIPEASNAAGSNALGLSPAGGDRMWMEYDISWLTALGDSDAHAMAQNITASIDAYAQANYAGVQNSHYESGDLYDAGYKPIFLNDAMYDQLPLQSYAEGNYERLKSIHDAVDPDGFFATRTGGFKYT
jgi:hypothetical protein